MKVSDRSSRVARCAWSTLLTLSMVASLGLAQFPVAAQPSGTNSLYTFKADFDFGTLQNTITALDPPGRTTGQVKFGPTISPFPYLYVAASGRGTLVRIDVKTGAILGEYLTAPQGNDRNPSRTTVDQLGNVWVANRDEAGLSPAGSPTPKGSVTRIGLIVGGTRTTGPGGVDSPNGAYIKDWTYTTCWDRNNDKQIKTSSGLADIRPWPGGGGGADTHGGVSTADDECIINYTRVAGTRTRTVAIDRNNDLWVGGDNFEHEKLSGALPPSTGSGQPIHGTQFNLGCGGYGGLIDKYGVLWSARYFKGATLLPPLFVPRPTFLLRYDPATKTGTCLNDSHGNYGLALDPKTCHVWHTTDVDPTLPPGAPNVPGFDPTLYTGQVVEMDRAGTILSPTGGWAHGKPFAQGVVVDDSGNVWVAHSAVGPLTGVAPIPGIVPATTVGHLLTNGTFVGNVQLVDPIKPSIVGEGPTGVAVDTFGKVWVTNFYTDNVMRINPGGGGAGGGGARVGAVDLTVYLGRGAAPYNYSDMTGGVAIGNPTQGFWNVVHDGLAAGTSWGMIEWNTEPEASVPAGSSIAVEARAADTVPALTGQVFIPVTSGVPFSLKGRHIEVKATMKTTVAGECVESPGPVLSDLRIVARTTCDIDVDGDVDQRDLSAISRARGQTPQPGDVRDANGDGAISPADVKACIPKCTRANCATQ